MKRILGTVMVLGVMACASAASAQSRIIIGGPPPPLSPVLFGPPGPPAECLVWNWQQYSYYNHCRRAHTPWRGHVLRVRG